jgi:hypothetical protein
MRWLFGAVLLVAAAQSAQAGNDALALYEQGDYERAIATASAQNNAAGFALAARAALADAMVHAPCLSCLKRTEALARKSVAVDAGLPEGHVYLAVALGYEARIIGPTRAQLGRYPEEARRNLDAALAADPRNALALAALGGWHIEIVRSGGASLAKWVYGASLEEGRKQFDAAFKVEPDNLVLRYQFVLSLGGLDLGELKPLVESTLERTLAIKARTAYERFAQARARELLTALTSNDDDAFRQLVRRDQGYP